MRWSELGCVRTGRMSCNIAATAAGLLLSSPVNAQSAADTATARELATQGIGLYQQQSYEQALDRLERAESLYDAPVHLLYIARTQAAMGRLVEAAETYRRLTRTELRPGSPRAFRESLDDGRAELGKLEPRIPALTLNLRPAKVEGLALSIDGESVSTAIVGVGRPINPGQHKIAVSAPGYLNTETTVALKEAEKKSVHVDLKEDDSSQASTDAVATPPPTSADTAPLDKPAERDGGSSSEQSERAKLLFGLRLSGQKPTGTLYSGTEGGDRPASDRFGAGGGVELRAGLEFARYFAGLLYYEIYSLAPGPGFDAPADSDYATELSTSPSMQAAGIGFAAGAPPGVVAERLRIFGEIGLSIVHQFKATLDAKSGTGTDALTCTATQSYSGGALRLGAGASYLVNKWLQVGPYVMASIGQFTSLDGKVDCGGTDHGDRLGQAIDFEGERKLGAKEQSIHELLGIGISAEALIPL